MKKLILLLLLVNHISFAQLFTFNVTDGTEAIQGVTIFLKLGEKSFAGATDADGVAKITLKENTKYKIRVSAVGFETLEQEIVTNKKDFKITLKASSTQLQEVSVKARKALITQDGDKSIVEPEALVQSSTNLMEVLEKTPGIFSDSDGNLYLSSSTPAKIYINGREQRMGSGDLATILRSLPPYAVEKIEIIRTPSASMDASSSGGSVNIILRKGYSMLGSGSVSGGFNQGELGNQFINASYNKSMGKTTYFVNGGYNRRNNRNFLLTDRQINANASLNSNSKIDSEDDSKVLNFGASHQINKSWEMSYDGRLIDRRFNSLNFTKSQSFFNGDVLFNNLNDVNSNGKTFNLNQNLNSVYKFDSLGTRKLVVDFSTDLIRPKSNQYYTNQLASSSEFGSQGAGDNMSSSDFYTLTADFYYQFKNKIKLESGGKVSLLNFSSSADFVRTQNGVTSPDQFRNNEFNYKNRISALYLQGIKNWGPYSVKAGVRMESTYMAGHQIIPSDTTFKIQRTDFFPFLYLGRTIGKIAGWDMKGYIIARRTISRPGYSQLNPFRQYVDEFTYQSGNPALRPQFTNNYEFNINIDGYPILAFGQNFVQDIFTSVIYQDVNNPQITNRTFDNLSKNKETYFRMVGALPPGGKYFFVLGTQFSLNDYSGFYEGAPVNFRRGTWRFFTFHELKIDKRSALSMQGFYSSRGQIQFTELSDFGNINLSLNRKFLQDKLVVTLNATDVLFTNKYDFKIQQGSMLASGNQYFDSRRVGVNVRYNFGRKKRNNGGFNLDMPDQTGGIE